MSSIQRTDRQYWAGVQPLDLVSTLGSDSSAGAGPLARRVAQEFEAVHQRWSDTFLYNPESLKAKFVRLRDQWLQDTEFSSSLDEIVGNPNYLQIIGMGPAVLPLILNELQDQPAFWFQALHSISGVDPVPSRTKGDLHAMVVAWLDWGRSRGFSD